MANPVFISALARAKRTMRRHQHVPSDSRLPMWRLVAGELSYLIGAAVRSRDVLVALAVVALVILALSPTTPGPVATPWLRVFTGAAASASVVWTLRRVRSSDRR